MPQRASTGSILNALRQDESQATWLAHLESLGDSPFEVSLPPDDAMADILRWLQVPGEDIEPAIASRPDPTRDRELWWLLERSVSSLVTNMGRVDLVPWFPSPHTVPGMSPYFFVHVYLATLPYTLTYFRERGVPDEIAQATLADLGRNMRVNRKRRGEGGLGVSFWLMLHFRGAIYQLGRLQFERGRVGGRTSESIIASGDAVTRDTPVLSLHIPDYLGPLSPEAIDDSLARARRFFATHFPDERYSYAVCHSWLLDPQLKEYLPETSNIVRFQRRFTLAERSSDADRSIVEFVFGPVPDDLDELPQRTALERAIVRHLKAGGHWYGRSGWFRLD